MEFRARDTALGDLLFTEALRTAQTEVDRNLLISLVSVAFNGPVPSDTLRRNTLEVIATFLLSGPDRGSESASTCTMASTAEPLLAHFGQLLPDKAGLVRTSIIRCRTTTDKSNSPLDASPNTVEELLQAADKVVSSNERAAYLGRAAYLASQQQDFNRAISILDGFSEEERIQLDGAWENWRWDFATSAAMTQLKRGDRYAVDKIIASTPAGLRAFVQISIANAIADSGDRGTAIRYLQEGRKGLEKVSASDAVPWYLSLLRRYERLAPEEGPIVFRELVFHMNHTETFAWDPVSADGSYSSAMINLPAFLLQMDIAGIRETASLLKSPANRAGARLALLNSSLELWHKESSAGKPTKKQARELQERGTL